jgi:hypothetical protein
MITIRIDVMKIDKKRLYKGQKGTYLDMVLIETPQSEFGNYMVVESITKEEREAGNKGTILGNGKLVWPVPRDVHTSKESNNIKKADTDNNQESEPDDLPF